MKEIKVLNHGHVRLVEHVGSDLSIVRAARVSYDAEWRAGDDSGSDAKLINYLMKNSHSTPFEMVDVTFDIKMPIFVARQMVRHRTASINEVSARYTELPSEFYYPSPDVIGKQSKTNKQGRDISSSIPEGARDAVYEARRLGCIKELKHHCETSYDLYQALLEQGWPRELARMCLPLNIYTHWFWKMDLHNLFHFLKLRLHPHAQYEIRVYAEAILELLEPVAPVSVGAFKKYQLS